MDFSLQTCNDVILALPPVICTKTARS